MSDNSKREASKREAAEDRPLLEVRDLDIAFGSKKKPLPTVFGASLSVYRGETVAIVGESGSGKSTTAAAILGLLQGGGHVTAGTIEFDGARLVGTDDSGKFRVAPAKRYQQLRGAHIGFVPQDPMSNLNPVWSVGYQIDEAVRANNVASGRKAVRARTIELLKEAGLSDAERRVNQYPHEFSGGMKQRALIATGLAARPELLIADEPTSALDVTVQRQILDHLEGLTSELGTAVLLITHDLGLAAERAQRIVVMSRGRIVESGPSLQILQNPKHEYTKRLVEAAPSLASRRIELAGGTAELREEVVAESVDEAESVAEEKNPDRDVIVAEDLTKVFKVRGKVPWKSEDVAAVKNVTFTMRRGTTTALVGESGSGKSTVAQMVLGLLEPTSGSVSFEGTKVSGLSRKGELSLRRKMQPVFQNPYGSLDPMYSIHNTIAEPMRIHSVGTKAERDAKVRELLEKVALPPEMARRFPGELSGGQRQRVAIARALALDPEVIVLDEAVSALDVLVQSQILDLLAELQGELGLTYLFITHDLAVVRQIADYVLVMSKGEVVEENTTDELFDNPREDYTQKLLAAVPGKDIDLGVS
ncbi:MAG TPA: ABC transporter ATP-binding protein [Dietzia timorensis]|uniref:ABC transporter ATP-binding protein n=1 Tax=Dietzia timorensis TaxID=499555 RepID=A0A921JXR8_9ACTN|nr:ABC transporter ATP-binding protein [Dietzia timorensis]HJE90530.1 ABC transporter ATP-binding protein [Dietzia timorensis]